MKIRTLAFSALIGATLSFSAYAQYGQGMGPGGGMGPGMGPGGGGGGMAGQGRRYQFNQDNTPGWSLMTPEERIAHRDRMMSAKTFEECKAAQAEHHKQMEERAKQKGATLAGPRENSCDRMKARGFYN